MELGRGGLTWRSRLIRGAVPPGLRAADAGGSCQDVVMEGERTCIERPNVSEG